MIGNQIYGLLDVFFMRWLLAGYQYVCQMKDVSQVDITQTVDVMTRPTINVFTREIYMYLG